MNDKTETQKVDVLAQGSAIYYQYRQHYLLGGALIHGIGTVIGRTVVGTDDAYAIKPSDGSAVVYVRAAGVRVLS